MKFKLKDDTELQVSDRVQFYARALRAIGQDLSGIFPQSLEIRAQGGNFEVVGRHAARSGTGKGAPKDQLLGKLRAKFLGEASPPEAKEEPAPLVDFRRTYSAADIQRLDEAGRNHRMDEKALPDIYSLGEVLRMVGRIIDSNGKRLQKVSRDNFGVRFEYEDDSGQARSGELSSLQLYKLQQQYHAERGTFVPVDNWKGCV
jgi:hypothetical protein